MVITEALGEIKTIKARLVKKRGFILENAVQWSYLKDPLEKVGGQGAAVAAERQAYSDLCERIVRLRLGIAAANAGAPLTLGGKTRSIADGVAPPNPCDSSSGARGKAPGVAPPYHR